MVLSINIDVLLLLFGINFFMDYLVIWAVARLSYTSFKVWRAIAAALAGASYVLLYLIGTYFEAFAFFRSLTFNLIIAIMMELIAFGRLPLRMFIKVLLYLYFVAAIVWGVSVGMMFLWVSRNTGFDGFHFTMYQQKIVLIIAVAVTIIIGKYGWSFVQRKLWKNLFQVPVQIQFDENIIKLIALVDTGNQLKDPLSRQPVVVVEYKALQHVLPENLREIFTKVDEQDIDLATQIIMSSPWYKRLRLIPFATIGKSNGMLIAFRADRIEIEDKERSYSVMNAIVGIYAKRLSPEGTYQALLHPEIFQAGF